jgi:hypothetical protein
MLLPLLSVCPQDAIKIRDAIRSALEATSSALTSAKDLVSTDTEPQASAAPAGTGVAGR